MYLNNLVIKLVFNRKNTTHVCPSYCGIEKGNRLDMCQRVNPTKEQTT